MEKAIPYSIIVDEVVFTFEKEELERYPNSHISRCLIGNTPTGEAVELDCLKDIKAKEFNERIVPIYKGSVDCIIAIDDDDMNSFQLASKLNIGVRVPIASEMVIKSAQNKSLLGVNLYEFIIKSTAAQRSQSVGMTRARIFVPHTTSDKAQSIMTDDEWVQNYRINACFEDANLRNDLIKRFNLEGIRMNIEHSEFTRYSKDINFEGSCKWLDRWSPNIFENDSIAITTFILNWGFNENDASPAPSSHSNNNQNNDSAENV